MDHVTNAALLEFVSEESPGFCRPYVAPRSGQSNLPSFAAPFACGVVCGALAMFTLSADTETSRRARTDVVRSAQPDVRVTQPSSLAVFAQPAPKNSSVVSRTSPPPAQVKARRTQDQKLAEVAASNENEVFNGSLRIESVPPGADVYLNSRIVGKTPLDLSNLTAGSRAVRVELDGRRWASVVQVVTGERKLVRAALGPEP